MTLASRSPPVKRTRAPAELSSYPATGSSIHRGDEAP